MKTTSIARKTGRKETKKTRQVHTTIIKTVKIYIRICYGYTIVSKIREKIIIKGILLVY